jgi:hypothetical protein
MHEFQSVAVFPQSHKHKFENGDLEIEFEGMPGKREKVEEVAEKNLESSRQRHYGKRQSCETCWKEN